MGVDRLETWWKGTPVVDEGNADEVAGRIEELVRDPGLAVELGAEGRERVRTRHLITRAVEDELRLAGSLLGTVTR
jgi:glycosyltransferase involved in cell wall biosynthesis